MNPKIHLTLAGCLLTLAPVSAQSTGPATFNAAGGTAAIGANTYEFSIAEMAVTTTYSGNGLVVTQGILQPQPRATGIAQQGILPTQLSVYPNPVEATLFLQPAFGKSGSLEYMLTDAAGRKIYSRTQKLDAGNERQEINMAPYAAGQYNLSIIWMDRAHTATGTYKIQKIQ